MKEIEEILPKLNAQEKAWILIGPKDHRYTVEDIQLGLRKKLGEDVDPISIARYLKRKKAPVRTVARGAAAKSIRSAVLNHFVAYHNTDKWGRWKVAMKGRLDSFFTAKKYHPQTLVGHCRGP